MINFRFLRKICLKVELTSNRCQIDSISQSESGLRFFGNLVNIKNGLILPTGQWYAPSGVIDDAWYCMVLHDTTWYCMMLHGIAWCCMVLHGSAWYYMVLHGIAWYCMVLHGIAW